MISQFERYKELDGEIMREQRVIYRESKSSTEFFTLNTLYSELKY